MKSKELSFLISIMYYHTVIAKFRGSEHQALVPINHQWCVFGWRRLHCCFVTVVCVVGKGILSVLPHQMQVSHQRSHDKTVGSPAAAFLQMGTDSTLGMS